MSDTTSAPALQTPAEVTYIGNHWQHLQPHVREAILTLVDGALLAKQLKAGLRRSADGESSKAALRDCHSGAVQ